MLKWFKGFKRSEKGQGMVEYGLILALVSIVALGALGGIGGKLSDTFDKVVGAVSGGEVIPEDSEGPPYTDEDIDDLVAEDYIPIATPDELDSLRKSEAQTFGQGTKWEGEYTSGLDKKYILVSDLDLDGKDNFEPIGTLNNDFKGTFNGGGYAISNLTIDKGSGNYAGLFGRAQGASIKNIGLEEVNVKGSNHVGGLVGFQSSSSTITNSYATGTVNGNDRVGGLVGRQYESSTITNSYATGNVTGDRQVGGLVGSQYESSTTSSYATGTVSGTSEDVGGLVGYQYESSITDSYATGTVTGTGNRVGGLVGIQSTSSTITSSYATGNVTGSDRVGGLVGSQQYSSTVTSSYATGEVTGGSSHVGGLVGYQSSSSTVTSSYYDKVTTKLSDTGKGEGKTSDEMKNKDTYVDWDFESVWKIESNQYPTHR